MVNLNEHSTLQLAATADAWREVCSEEELHQCLKQARSNKQRVLPVGEGSNVVFAGHIPAMLIRQSGAGIHRLEEANGHSLVRVEAGLNWQALVDWSLEQELFGLENLALIPGTVGAAPIQNIGAYGVEVAAYISGVHCVHLEDLTTSWLSASQCGFGYRDSVFKRELRDRVIITSVDFRLPQAPAPVFDYPDLQRELANIAAPTPQQVHDAVVVLRRRKLPDPALEPNVGSFFKNPVLPVSELAYLKLGFSAIPVYPVDDNYRKVSAAWLIDQCGLKGAREGGIGVHEGHALVLVNYGGGTGQQLLMLVERIQEQVLRRFGIRLDVEPRIYGD